MKRKKIEKDNWILNEKINLKRKWLEWKKERDDWCVVMDWGFQTILLQHQTLL